MQISEITEITNGDIRNINTDRLVSLAKNKFVVMTFDQWKEIIEERTDAETYMAVHSLMIQITYLGFFQDTEENDTFKICICTGVDVPFNLTSAWTQITNPRIATTHATNLPWIVFQPSTILDEASITFIQEFFTFIAEKNINQNITIYSLMPRDIDFEMTDDESPWYWMYGTAIDRIPKGIHVNTLMPIPGEDDTVILIDRANNTHQYTFDSKRGELIELDKPQTVL